jgi:hypothetical protein
MATTNAQRVKKSRDLNNDCIVIRPKKNLGTQIRQAAADAGENLTVYILKAIEMRMENGK